MGLSSSLRVFSLRPSPYKEIMSKMETLIMLRTEDQYKSLKLGYQLWIWMNSNCFIRKTGLSKYVLVAFIQHCRYDTEMTFNKLREWRLLGVQEFQLQSACLHIHCCPGVGITTGSRRVPAGKVLKEVRIVASSLLVPARLWVGGFGI